MVRKKSFILILSSLLSVVTIAQTPVIYSVDRSNAAMTDVVTIHGSDFGTNPSQIRVFFGSARAEVRSLTNQLIEARTPAGATFDRISVTNVASGRTAFAPNPFLLNYGGENGIAANEFAAQADFQAQSGLYDLCLCDFNDDGKVDVATASSNSNLITVFQNNSTPQSISLAGNDILVNARSLHVVCGDLNGDGRKDIVLSEASDGSRILVLTNNGSFSFSVQTITLQSTKVKRVAIADLDLDGRPEIIVTNTGGNNFSILPNQSTLSSIIMGTARQVTLSQASSTDALEISDLDGDGLPEIITSQYQADSENKLFICRNGGSFDFSDVMVIQVNKAISNIRAADLNADRKIDLVIARLTGSDVSIYINNATTGISFATPSFFATESLPVGIDLSDLDGDGKPDLIVGSIAKSVSVLDNNLMATGGAIAPVVKLPTTYINRNVKSADMDGDGKPDVIFTSVDDFSGTPVPASKISVIRNTSCMVPAVTPGGSLNICSGNTIQLRATASGGTTYEWFKDGSQTPLRSGSQNSLEVSTSGEYKVVATLGSCSRQSAVVNVSVTTPANQLNAIDPDARSNGPVCTDNALTLQVNDMAATEYRWRGPNGFTSTVTSTQATRQSFTLDDAGLYVVEMLSGSCVARVDSTLVEAISVPEFSITFGGEGQFCEGSSKTLTLTPALSSGFSYQWYEKTLGAIANANTGSLSVTATGEYHAVITPENAGCVPRQTAPVTLAALSLPVASFDIPAKGCVSQGVEITQQSQTDPLASVLYSWNFGNGQSSEDPDPEPIFSQTGTFTVKLTISYDGVAGCSANVSKNIELVNAVKPEITTASDALCTGESTTLSIAGNFGSITWSNYQTTATITVDAAGTYSVTTVDGTGCGSSDEIVIAERPSPELVVSADKTMIAAGQSATLNVTGADTYAWSPGETLSNSTLANPVATPSVTTTYTVEGQLTDGCAAMASITIEVSGEVISINVPVLFSPNGDGQNETLVVDGVERYPDCTFNVFDRRGGKVFGTVGYQSNWDGTIRGTPVPAGVYYYVFGCPNRKSKTGTVTVIR